ncbi:MAG: HEAT repeat domain-containing protein [Chloroflexota bacterium]
MFDQTVQQLASPDPAIRRKAITALGTMGDSRALRPLANTFKTDTDPALRELALKAGRHIKGLTAAAPTGPALATPASTLQSRALSKPAESAVVAPIQTLATLTPMPEILPEKSKPIVKPISDQMRQNARRKLDTAIDMMSRGEGEKAMNELTEAVRMDPTLAENSLARNVVVTLTGMDSPDDAMAMIVERATAPKKGKSGSASIPDQSVSSSAGVDNSMIELALMLVGVFVLLLILGFVGRYWITNNMDILLQSSRIPQSATRVNNPQLMKSYLDTMKSSLNTILSTSNILIFGLFGTIAILFNIGVNFGIGTLMGGSGSLVRFMNALLRIYLVQYVLAVIGIGVMAFSIYKAMPVITITLIASTVNTVLKLLSLGAFIWQVYAISRSREVTIIKGFVILIAGSVVTGCIGAIIAFFVINQMASQIVSLGGIK